MYAHPILVPGAVGHDDPEALRQALEEYCTAHVSNINGLDDVGDITEAVASDIDDIADELAARVAELRASVTHLTQASALCEDMWGRP